MEQGKLAHLKVASIQYGTRYRDEMGDLEALKQSITDEGLIHPIAVMEEPDGSYVLLAGGRRYTAIKELGWELIPCHIYPHLNDIDRRTIELKENMVRENLTYAEEAKITLEIHRLQQLVKGDSALVVGGQTLQDTADLLGQSKSKVFQDMQLAEMIEVIPELGECENRQEALRLLKKAKDEVARDKKAASYEATISSSGEDVQRKSLIDSFIIKDCREGLKSIQSGQLDLVELDPPYAINLHKVKKTEDFIATKDYTEIPPEQYIQDLTLQAREAFRILKDNGWFLVWFSIKWWYEETALVLEQAGFKVNRVPLIWTKDSGQTLRPDLHLASCYDTLFYARKGMATIRKQGSNNILRTPVLSSADKTHPTERPIGLYEELFSLFASSGDLVCIPYLGSGNSILAANNLRMKAFGFELSQGNKNYFINKVNEGIPGEYED